MTTDNLTIDEFSEVRQIETKLLNLIYRIEGRLTITDRDIDSNLSLNQLNEAWDILSDVILDYHKDK